MADNLYADGQSVLPQTRAAATVEWAYADGQSGGVPVGQASGAVTYEQMLAATVTMIVVAAEVRAFVRALAVSVTTTPALVKRLSVTLAVEVTAAAVLALAATFRVVLEVPVTVAVGFVKRIAMTLAVSTSVAVRFVRAMALRLLATTTVTPGFAERYTAVRELAATSAVTVALVTARVWTVILAAATSVVAALEGIYTAYVGPLWFAMQESVQGRGAQAAAFASRISRSRQAARAPSAQASGAADLPAGTGLGSSQGRGATDIV